jgi:hypothetical protein
VNPRTASIIVLGLVAIAALMVLFKKLKDDTSSAMDAGTVASLTQNSERKRESNSKESQEERLTRVAREEMVQEVKQKQLTFWTKNASAGLTQSKKNLVADLNLSAEEAAGVEKIFDRRDTELAGLLAKMHSGEAAHDVETMRKICGLLRNKGLREDLAGILSPEKLATFDANEATRERETIEARAYRDMAVINDVVSLTNSQKQQALAALMKNAPANVEQEADARAFMTLHYGQMLTDVDSSAIRGMSNMLDAALKYELPADDTTSPPYQQWTQDNKTQRINNSLSALQPILDEKQLARYREHLEAEPAW